MIIKDKKFIPDAMIEAAASRLLSNFETQYGKILHPPVPIDKIIENYLDLLILWDDIEDTEDEKILGCLESDQKRIILNERHLDHFEEYLGTEAYTKAHEVGHWDLHIIKARDAVQLPLFSPYGNKNVLCRNNQNDSREIQAEMYAAYLLMPYSLVMNEIKGIELTSFSNLYQLKDTFGVTITAFTKRLTRLGLIYISSEGKIFHSKQEASGERTLF